MFDRLYTRPVVIATHCNSPLAEERIAYLCHLEAIGRPIHYLRDTAAYLFVIAHWLNVANRPGEHISIRVEMKMFFNASRRKYQHFKTVLCLVNANSSALHGAGELMLSVSVMVAFCGP